jgi:hypothetical protein
MRKNRENENEEFRIRFIDVTVRGSGSTLQEAIRSISSAVGQRPAINNTSPTPKALSSAAPAEVTQPTLGFDDIEEAEVTEREDNDKAIGNNSKPRKRTYTSPKLLDIDLDGGELSFASYCQRVNPSDVMKKYLIVAAWLKEHRGLNQITAAHVYTCFRKMRWEIQKDMGQPLRTGKKQDYFKSGSTSGTYELTHIGLDAVRKMGG